MRAIHNRTPVWLAGWQLISSRKLVSGWQLLLLLAVSSASGAAPFVPNNDTQVLERLPSSSRTANLRALQAAVSANPRDDAAAALLARGYFRLAIADGDPRYIGYAHAALARWWSLTDAPTDILVARALVKQYGHDFSSALADLAQAGGRDPQSTEIWSWRAALHLVQADYALARAACDGMKAHGPTLDVVACETWVDGTTGRAGPAYDRFAAARRNARDLRQSDRLWFETRLAELALRAGRPREGERHFRAALTTGISDQYLLAAYADFLLDANRAKEVTALLAGWEAADGLLLRLALAAQRQNAANRDALSEQLRARFAAAAQRGDTLHQQEEARFLLHFGDDRAGALKLATANWSRQREPRDARVLLAAALAVGDRAAAKPALDWLARTAHEDAAIRDLADQLARLPSR